MIFFPGLRPDINSLLTFMGEFHFDSAKTMVNWASNGPVFEVLEGLKQLVPTCSGQISSDPI